MSDDEEKRLKLEEARKRVEELRKKKKNKSKKKKGSSKKEDKSEEADVSGDVTIDSVVEGATSEVTEPRIEVDTSVVDSTQPAAEESDLKVMENKQVKESEITQPDAEKEATAPTVANTREEVTAEEQDDTYPAKQKEEEEKEEEEESRPEPEQTSETGNSRLTESSSPREEGSELQFDDENAAEGDFLTTIEKAKEEQIVTDLKKQIEELTAEIKKLKFLNIDRESTIEDLETELEDARKEISQTQAELANVKEENMKLRMELEKSELKLRSTDRSPTIQFSNFNSPVLPAAKTMSSGNFGHGYQEIPTHTVDRVVLNQWRNWNVDMTTWRSIGTGPIMEF